MIIRNAIARSTSRPETATRKSATLSRQKRAIVTPAVEASNASDNSQRVRCRLAGEEGAATAEYAVATMAAVGFAGLLVVILRGDEVRAVLTDLIRAALSTNL